MFDLNKLTAKQIDALVETARKLPDDVSNLLSNIYPKFKQNLDLLEKGEGSPRAWNDFLKQRHGETSASVYNVFKKAENDYFLTELGANNKKSDILASNSAIRELLNQDKVKEKFKDFSALEKHYNELKGIKAEYIKKHYAKSLPILKEILDAKKKVFLTQKGKEALMAAFDADAAEGIKSYGWFTATAKHHQSIPEMIGWNGKKMPNTGNGHYGINSGIVDEFINALKGGITIAPHKDLERVVHQSIELSYIKGKPFHTVIKDRMIASGIVNEHQAEFLSKVAHDFEQEVPANKLLSRLRKTHASEIEVLRSKQIEGEIAQELAKKAKPVNNTTSNVPELNNGVNEEAKAFTQTGSKVEHAANVENKGFIQKIRELPTGKKWALGGGVAAVIAAGGWVAHEYSKRNNDAKNSLKREV